MQTSATRDSLYLDFTRSICPVCKVLIDAEILVRENRVIMRKRCKEHDWFETLLSSDADYFRWAQKFNKPGTLPAEFATETKEGCPYDCGLCPEHQQHTCLGIQEAINSLDDKFLFIKLVSEQMVELLENPPKELEGLIKDLKEKLSAGR